MVVVLLIVGFSLFANLIVMINLIVIINLIVMIRLSLTQRYYFLVALMLSRMREDLYSLPM